MQIRQSFNVMSVDSNKLNLGAERWEKALTDVIKTEIGPSAVDVVKNRLLEKYGTTINQSFQKWDNIEDILRENFGDGYIRISSKFISTIANAKPKYDQKIFNPENNSDEIIKLIGDPEIGAMLDQVLDDGKIIKDIIKESNVPQTTAYRKIEKMKQAGLLIECGFILSHLNKKIVKYTSPFKSYSIIHERGKSFIKYGPKQTLRKKLISTSSNILKN